MDVARQSIATTFRFNFTDVLLEPGSLSALPTAQVYRSQALSLELDTYEPVNLCRSLLNERVSKDNRSKYARSLKVSEAIWNQAVWAVISAITDQIFARALNLLI